MNKTLHASGGQRVAMRLFWAVLLYLLPLFLTLTSTSVAQTDTALNGPGNVFLTANLLSTGGGGPTAVAVGDFNKDSNLDFVVVNAATNNIGVLLGNGDGTFRMPETTPVSCLSPSVLITVADFNRDGIPDVALVANGCTSAAVDVLLGKGDGTFTLKSSISLPGAQSVVAADFNGDGKLDLAIVVQGSPDNVTVIFGNGDGTFQTSTPKVTSLGSHVGALEAAVADFNKDGHKDLAVSAAAPVDELIVLLGKGDGTFQSPPTTLSLPAAGYGIAVGDFNNDGNPDLVATTPGDGGVSIFLGDGTGEFAPVNNPVSGTLPTASAFIPTSGPTAVAVADFNNDGKQDVIVALNQPAGNSGVGVLLGNGNGTLQSQLVFDTAPSLDAVAVGDFNGDGKLDWVATTNNPVDSATLALGRGDGTFQAARIYIADNAPVWLAVADFNHDGVLDMVVPNYPSNDISILLGNKDGSFKPPVNMPFPGFPGVVVTGDFNNDGKQDIAVFDGSGNPSTVVVYLGNGDGTFQAPKSFSTGGINGGLMVTGDFNGDGKLDLAVSNSNGVTPNVAILLGNGDGTFKAPIITDTGGGSLGWLAAADFNKDGHLDLLAVDNTNGDVAIFLGKGDGTFKSPTTLARKFANTATVGDFNNDGKPDFVVISGDGNAYVYLGKGDGTFDLPLTVTLGSPLPPSGATWVAAADFNLDGNLDFVVGEPPLRGINNGYQGMQLLLGNGDGTFQSVQDYLGGAGNVVLQPAIGDFNGDGAPDVALMTLQNSILVLLNQTRALKVSLAGTGSGSVTSGPAGIKCPSKCVFGFSDGTVVTLTATAATGSEFEGWGGVCSGTGTCTVTMTQSKAVTATFDLVFPLSVTLAGLGSGAVKSSPAGISCPGTCTANFKSGTTVTLSETPGSNSTFAGWSGACTGTGGCSVTMTSAKSVTATFNTAFPLTVTLAGTGKGTVTSSPVGISCPGTCTANFKGGIVVTLTQKAAPGSAFAGWSGACSGTSACSVTMNAAKSVTATFNLVLIFSPPSLAFGGQLVGTTSLTKTVTLTNTGPAALVISSISGSGNFKATSTCPISPSTLTRGGKCSITVAFKPSVPGAISGEVTVKDNGSGAPHLVNLSGTGLTAITLTPPSIAFGPVAVGKTSPATTVTLTNNLTTTLTIGFSASGDYAAVRSGVSPCGVSLAGKANCTMSVTFKPKSNGALNGAVTVTYSASFSPQEVALTGTGTGGPASPLSLSPPSLSFAAQLVGTKSAAKTVTITNSSGATLTISKISASGNYIAAGSGATPCGGSLANGAKCTIAVTFSPSINGAINGAVTIVDSTGVSPQVYNLFGTGVLPLSFSLPSIAFPAQTVGTTSSAVTVTLNNNQATGLSITFLASGQFKATAGGATPCGSSLAGKAKCTISVSFTPSVIGPVKGVVTFTYSGGPFSPVEITLSGAGQ